MKNESALIALRPDLSHLATLHSSPEETFQNQVLRPILKMQHELLVSLVFSSIHFTRLIHQVKTEEAYQASVIDYLKKQTSLKNQVIGMVIGHFTESEWSNYFLNTLEFNKRIIQMSGTRVASAIYRQ